MSEKVERATKRLNEILPLKEGLQKSNPQMKSLYHKILMSFVSTGNILSKYEMKKYINDVESAIQIFDDNEMVIVSDSGDLIGAYPFTMEDRENKVRVNGFEVNAMCAVDALAVSQMYDLTTQIYSRCRITDAPIYLEQADTKIINLDEHVDIQICIAWESTQTNLKCANSLCREIFFVDSKKTADIWQKGEPRNREIFTLDEAVELARKFFVPLMS